MNNVSIRELSRNPSAVVEGVVRLGSPALVTGNCKAVAALVRIDQVALEDWIRASAGHPQAGRNERNQHGHR